MENEKDLINLIDKLLEYDINISSHFIKCDDENNPPGLENIKIDI